MFQKLGLGANVPLAMTNGGEAVTALVNGKFVVIRIPYPMGFFSKNVDGRIDNPNAGWKRKGLWTTLGTRTVFHNEGGTSSRPKVYKIQVPPIHSRGDRQPLELSTLAGGRHSGLDQLCGISGVESESRIGCARDRTQRSGRHPLPQMIGICKNESGAQDSAHDTTSTGETLKPFVDTGASIETFV